MWRHIIDMVTSCTICLGPRYPLPRAVRTRIHISLCGWAPNTSQNRFVPLFDWCGGAVSDTLWRNSLGRNDRYVSPTTNLTSLDYSLDDRSTNRTFFFTVVNYTPFITEVYTDCFPDLSMLLHIYGSSKFC